MIVRCANCQTEFSLDDRRVGPEGSAVRCSVCGYVFRVEPPAHAAADHPWQIRTVEDLLFTAPDLATLRAWIGEGRLHPDDHVSRTGKHWVRLGDMSEFADAFAEFQELPKVVEPVDDVPAAPSETSATDALGPPPAFGTGASEASGPSVFAAVAPLAETHTEELRVAIEDARSREGAPRPLSRTASEGIVVGRVGSTGPQEILEALKAPPPPPPSQRPASGDAPASMLDAVSRNVKPIPAVSTEAPKPVAPPVAEPDPLGESLSRGQRAEAVEDAVELEPARKRSVFPLVAGFGLVVAVAAVVAIPDLRERALALVSPDAAPAQEFPPAVLDLPTADAALHDADPVAIGKAEAELQGRIDGGGASAADVATMKLAQVELLTTRAITNEIVAALAPKQAERAAKNAADDAARAAGIFDQVNSEAVVERDRIRTARARLRLVQGRPPEEIVALLPEGVDELRHVVTAAPLWRDPEAPVPDGVITGLAALERPSVTARLVLALAYLRSGDEAGATRTVERVLADVPAQPAGLAVQAALRGPDDSSGLAEAKPDDTKKPEVVAAAKPAGVDQKSAADKAAAKPASAGLSIDRLIDRGCDLVDGGKASEGIEMLETAEQKRPNDLDVLVCLGIGHSKQGRHSSALKYFERALARNPGYGAALRGAAKAAKAAGNTQKAVEYYQRVLKIEPRNAEARAYVEANIGAPSAG